MKISIIHPSRGRPVKARATAKQWLTNLTSDAEIEYILSIDDDDSQKRWYHEWFNFAKITTGHNHNVVEAMNAGAAAATGDILVCISDDFECPNKWDELLINASPDWQRDIAIRINDTITKESDVILTLPILSKTLYDKLKYIYHPSFTGMFADNDLAEECVSRNCLIQKWDLVFAHNHWVNGKAPKDDTYNRHNTTASWTIGINVIEQRRKERHVLTK